MEQLKGIFKMPSRQAQLWLLILLSAATMIVPYGIQGALSSGKEPAAVSDEIWLLDNIAWAIRAMVEGLVIAYIARTKTSTRLDTILLWAAEGALVALITLTLGPTLYAALNGLAMKEALPKTLQWLWALGLASYMPLMVLGASYAYKVQPHDDGETTQPKRNNESKPAQAQVKSASKKRKVSAAKRQRAAELLAENSKMSGAELGRKVGASEQWGRQLKAEWKAQANGKEVQGEH